MEGLLSMGPTQYSFFFLNRNNAEGQNMTTVGDVGLKVAMMAVSGLKMSLNPAVALDSISFVQSFCSNLCRVKWED